MFEEVRQTYMHTKLTFLIFGNQDLTEGNDTVIPVFDYQQKRRVGYKAIMSASSGVVSLADYGFDISG